MVFLLYFFAFLQTAKLYIKKISLWGIIMFVFLLINNLINSSGFNYSVLFIVVFWLVFIFFDSYFLQNIINDKIIVSLVIFVTFFSFIGFDFNVFQNYNDFEYRFHGFSGTATTFSTYILLFYVLGLYRIRNMYLKLFLFIGMGLLIFMSKTRTTLILFLLLNLFFLIKGKITAKQLNLFFILSIVVVLLIPVFSNLLGSENLNDTVVSREGKDGIDHSMVTRNYLYLLQFDALLNMNIFDVFFGKGINSSLFIEGTLEELDPHNDFFKLFYDYGLLYIISFLIFLKNKITDHYTFSIVMIYIFSFYHNMLYSSIFILFLNIDLFNLETNKLQNFK